MENKIANILLDCKAVKVNPSDPFTYASGIRSPIYCDNRELLGFFDARNTIIESFLEVIPNDVDIIVGVATAGIPWGAIIAHMLNKPFSYVRAKAKDHGVGKQVEGADIAGKKLAVIEDLISTGGSSLEAVKALYDNGAAKADVYAIFTYEFANIDDAFKNANSSLKTLSKFSVLIENLIAKNVLTKEQGEIVSEWNKSPKEWYDNHFTS